MTFSNVKLSRLINALLGDPSHIHQLLFLVASLRVSSRSQMSIRIFHLHFFMSSSESIAKYQTKLFCVTHCCNFQSRYLNVMQLFVLSLLWGHLHEAFQNIKFSWHFHTTKFDYQLWGSTRRFVWKLWADTGHDTKWYLKSWSRLHWKTSR